MTRMPVARAVAKNTSQETYIGMYSAVRVLCTTYIVHALYGPRQAKNVGRVIIFVRLFFFAHSCYTSNRNVIAISFVGSFSMTGKGSYKRFIFLAPKL